LFPPRSSRRRPSAARGAAKILLVGAVAAPATYFIANWMQFPGTAAPSDSASISGSASIAASTAIPGAPEDRIAALALPQKRPPPEAVQTGTDLPGATQPEAMVGRGLPPAETSSDAVADAGTAEPKGLPERPPGVSAPPPPSDPAPGPVRANAAQSSSEPPVPVAAPPRSVLSAQDIAFMLQRGRALFDAGDLAAARLFF